MWKNLVAGHPASDIATKAISRMEMLPEGTGRVLPAREMES